MTFRTCPLERLKCVLRAWKCWTPATNCLLRLKTLSRQVVYCKEAHFMHHFWKCSIILFCGHGDLAFWVFPLGYHGRSMQCIHFCHCMLFKGKRFSLFSEFHKVFLHKLLETDHLKYSRKQVYPRDGNLSAVIILWLSYRHICQSNICVCFVVAEIRSSPDAVSLSRSPLISNAVQSETAVTTCHENERVPLQCTW